MSDSRAEEGQILILAAGTLAMVLSFAALAIDGGLFAHTKRDLQNDADAMVLAAVRDMPNEDLAEEIALDWAENNNVADSEIASISFDSDCSGHSSPQTVTVQLQREQKTFLARVMGINEGALGVCAAARTGFAVAGPGLMPFGLLFHDPEITNNPPVCYYDHEDKDDFWGNECAIKIPLPAQTWTPGNSGPLRLDDSSNAWEGNFDADCNPPGSNSGESEYEDNILHGSDCRYAPLDLLQTFTGSLVGPTCDAIDTLLGANYDTIDDVFKDIDGDGTYEVVVTTSPRYALVPVVEVPEGSAGSSTNVTVVTFAAVYLHGCNGGLGANPASVVITPMKSKIFLNGIDFVGGNSDDYTTDWPLYTIKLID